MNKIDGYVWGFGISVEAIETSPAGTGQSTPNTRITVRNLLGGVFDDALRFINTGTLRRDKWNALKPRNGKAGVDTRDAASIRLGDRR